MDKPASKPYLWQRGLSLYYAERFADGSEQFSADVAVNPNDTEETIWNFLCVARTQGFEAARSKMLLEERDLAVLERDAAAVKHGVELATKVEELEALRVAKDSEHKKLTENRASLKAALEAKGREALELAAELNVLRSMQEEELREIKEGAERQWADFSGQQRAMLQDRLQRSVGERITTAAEVQIKEIASQLLASKQECEATNGLLRTMRGKFDEMEQTMLDRESTSELNREHAL